MKVKQACKFAIDHRPADERAMRSHAGAARFAWNRGLRKCTERYEAERKWYSAAELHKRTLLVAGRWYPSSKLCSACGWRKPSLTLAQRTFACEICGHTEDRDVNAARNLLKLAASGAESINACGGTVRPRPARQVPVKQEPGTAPAGKTGTAAPQGTAAA